jgi:hypothetical protein
MELINGMIKHVVGYVNNQIGQVKVNIIFGMHQLASGIVSKEISHQI